MDVCEWIAAVTVVAVEGLLAVRIFAMRAIGRIFDHGGISVRSLAAVIYLV